VKRSEEKQNAGFFIVMAVRGGFFIVG